MHAYYSTAEQEMININVPNARTKDAPADAEPIFTKNQQSADVVFSTTTHPVSEQTRWRKAFRSTDEASPKASLLDPDEALTKSSRLALMAEGGDSTASLSLHGAVEMCLQQKEDLRSIDCKNLLTKTGDEPLKWLLISTALNDPRATLSVLGLARDMAGGTIYSSRAGFLSHVALSSMEGAIELGDSNSLRLLAITYSEGLLVQPDPVKAFAFMDAYAKVSGDSAASLQAEKMGALLRAADKTDSLNIQRELLEKAERKINR